MKKKVTRRERKKLLDEMVKIAQENGEYNPNDKKSRSGVSRAKYGEGR